MNLKLTGVWRLAASLSVLVPSSEQLTTAAAAAATDAGRITQTQLKAEVLAWIQDSKLSRPRPKLLKSGLETSRNQDSSSENTKQAIKCLAN